MPNADKSSRADAGSLDLTVLQVLPALESGGVERGTVDIAEAIVAAGGRALVASAGGAMTRELARVGAEHFEMPLGRKNPFSILRNGDRLAELCRLYHVDLIHARSRAPAWAAWRAARETGATFVTTFHGTYNFRNPLKKAYNAIMTRGIRVIAISRFIARHIEKHYRIDPARLRVVYRGIDLNIFDPSKVHAARVVQLSEQWRVPDGVPVVMMPGRLTRWKGQTVFLEALARVRRDDYLALVVGSDQGRSGYRAELESLVKRHDLESRVRFVDHCNDMAAAFLLADVVVSASTDPEAFGRVLVEAQAMGRPVIASDHGGAQETVLPGRTGWLIPPADPRALAAAIEHALALDEHERAEMAAAGMENARSRFSKERMAGATLGVYREAMAEHRANRS